MASSSSTTIGSESKFKDHRESPVERGRRSKRLGKSRSLDRFQVLLYDIAEELDKDDLKSMILLCYPHISKRQLNKIEVAEELFAKLCEKDIINDRNTVFLEKLLSHIGKKQLLQRVEAYHRANTADTDTMTEESESEFLTKKRTSKRKRSLDSPDSATPQVQRKSMTKKQKRLTHSKLPDQALSDLRSLRPKQEKYPDEILKVVAKPRLTKGKQQKSLQFPVADRSGVIRTCVAFGETAERLYSEIDESRVYVMSGYGIEKANPKFNKDPIQIVLDDMSEIKLSDFDDFGDLLSYHRIDDAVKTEQRSHIRGILRRIGKLTNSRQAKMKVREIIMVDESIRETKVTFFEEIAKHFNFLVGQTLQVTFVRGVPPNKDSEAYLKTTIFSTAAVSDITIQIDDSKVKTSLPKYTDIKVESLKEVKKSESEGVYDIASVCTIVAIRLSNSIYTGCDVEGCEKKVSLGTNDRAVCPTHKSKCGTRSYFNIRVNVTDSSGSIWVMLFDRHVTAISDLTTAIETLPTETQNEKIIAELKDVSVALVVSKKGKGRNAQYTAQKISKV